MRRRACDIGTSRRTYPSVVDACASGVLLVCVVGCRAGGEICELQPGPLGSVQLLGGGAIPMRERLRWASPNFNLEP
jgi:hypothetical protein